MERAAPKIPPSNASSSASSWRAPGFPVMGMWREGMDGTDINACDRSPIAVLASQQGGGAGAARRSLHGSVRRPPARPRGEAGGWGGRRRFAAARAAAARTLSGSDLGKRAHVYL